MKNDVKPNISLERYYSAITHFIISSEEGILTRKEIEDHMVRDKICQGRQVSKILKHLTDKEYLVQEKMLGTKRRGYTINEEIIGKKNESFVTIGINKKGMPIYDTITLRALTSSSEANTALSKGRLGISFKASTMPSTTISAGSSKCCNFLEITRFAASISRLITATNTASLLGK